MTDYVIPADEPSLALLVFEAAQHRRRLREQILSISGAEKDIDSRGLGLLLQIMCWLCVTLSMSDMFIVDTVLPMQSHSSSDGDS